jgi:hypothetical protein
MGCDFFVFWIVSGIPFAASVMEIHFDHIPTKIRNWTVVFDVESTVGCCHAGSFHLDKTTKRPNNNTNIYVKLQ